MNKSYDVVIVGGGIMGCSTAFWLSKLEPKLRILVVERDRSYAQAGTALSVASIRLQFSSPTNIKISQFGIDFIRNIEDWLGHSGEVSDLGFQENGYLFLAGTDADAGTMREVVGIQHNEGATTNLLTSDAISMRWPWLATDDVSLGSFGSSEGWFDNMGLLWGFRRTAKANGVTFLEDEVADLVKKGTHITGISLKSGEIIDCGAVVNSAGTRAAYLMEKLSEELPVEPRKRSVFLIDAPNAHEASSQAPLLVDHQGFYLRPEGKAWIVATVPKDDGPCALDDFEPDLNEFEDCIWENLYNRASVFDAVKVIRAWAGHYDYNRLDQNAVVGLWPGYENLYLMNGFSGHGLQQAPALGRGIAELITRGAYQSLDLKPLGAERLMSKSASLETAIV